MKKKCMKRAVDVILFVGIILGFLGAAHIAITFHNYAISGCLVLAAILMILLLKSGKKKANDSISVEG